MKNIKETIAYSFVAVGVILWFIGIVLATATGDDPFSLVNSILTGGLALLLAAGITVTVAELRSVVVAVAVTLFLAFVGGWGAAWAFAVMGGGGLGIGLAIWPRKDLNLALPGSTTDTSPDNIN
jgi:hypothetical protein